jgi:hypothetical protein
MLRREWHGQQSSAGRAVGGVAPGEPIADPPALQLAQIDGTMNTYTEVPDAKTPRALKRPGGAGGPWTAATGQAGAQNGYSGSG